MVGQPAEGPCRNGGRGGPSRAALATKEKSIAPRSAAIDIKEGLIRGTKQERHLAAQDGLLESEWRRLPEILAKPEAIYFDTRTGKLVYVVSAGDGRASSFQWSLMCASISRIGPTGSFPVSAIRQNH